MELCGVFDLHRALPGTYFGDHANEYMWVLINEHFILYNHKRIHKVGNSELQITAVKYSKSIT
jgi:hypothetical protein